MMRLWKVVVVVNVALALGIGLGYLRWARENRDLRTALARAEDAARHQPGTRSWTVRGVVRSVIPRLGVVFLTHEAIPGLMDGMTMGFEADDPKILSGFGAGDSVRFTVRQEGERMRLSAIEKSGSR
jgi:Cu/Ag efflux protein CusF